VRGPGDLLGEMSLLQQCARTASVQAVTDGRLYRISSETFTEMVSSRPATTLAILRTVMARLRNTEAMLQQNEKLGSLGVLAAGLAHELNNPASAARRAGAQLQASIQAWQQLTLALGALQLDSAQSDLIHTLGQEMIRRATAPAKLDPLARSEREETLQTWLEQQAIEPAWDLAPALVSFGWGLADLQAWSAQLPGPALAAAVRWLCAGCSAFALVDEVHRSAGQISTIVQAVKAYTYLDQAPIQDIDVHAGLDNTLVILQSRLNSGIGVYRDYAPDLPRIEAYGSELNQAWTNILENAIDAVGTQGEIRIRTGQQDDFIVVEISDNGPGIPAEIRSRIFDPFFTTKPPGQGTGLGLNLTYNIIKNHGGQIEVASRPGETTLRVFLPLHLPLV